MTKQGDDGRAAGETRSDVAPGPTVPEGKAPEGKAPEGKAPEGKAPEGKAPEGKAPEGKAPEGKAPRAHPKDPLHGVTLQTVLEELHTRYGWAELGRRIPIRCFTHEPSMGSSLAFLRRQPWARSQVEDLYLRAKRNR